MKAPTAPTRDQIRAACEALGLESTKVSRVVMEPKTVDVTVFERLENGDMLPVTYHLNVRNEAVEAAFRGESA